MTFEFPVLVVSVPVLVVALLGLMMRSEILRQRALREFGVLPQREYLRAIVTLVSTVGALTCILLALAGPHMEGKAEWKRRGMDLVFVYDFSKSMLAKDVYPSRIKRSLREGEWLIANLAADRIATVVYAGGALHFPLSHDHSAARQLYAGVRPGDLAPGSDTGQALQVATCLLDAASDLEECTRFSPKRDGLSLLRAESPGAEERAKAIVLFTDGEDSDGQAPNAAAHAIAGGISVIVVAVGTATAQRIPLLNDDGHEVGWERDSSSKFRTTTLDNMALLRMREEAAIELYQIGGDGDSVDDLLTALQRLKRGDLDSRRVDSKIPMYLYFLWPALLLLVLQGMASFLLFPFRARARAKRHET